MTHEINHYAANSESPTPTEVDSTPQTNKLPDNAIPLKTIHSKHKNTQNEPTTSSLAQPPTSSLLRSSPSSLPRSLPSLPLRSPPSSPKPIKERRKRTKITKRPTNPNELNNSPETSNDLMDNPNSHPYTVPTEIVSNTQFKSYSTGNMTLTLEDSRDLVSKPKYQVRQLSQFLLRQQSQPQRQQREQQQQPGDDKLNLAEKGLMSTALLPATLPATVPANLPAATLPNTSIRRIRRHRHQNRSHSTGSTGTTATTTTSSSNNSTDPTTNDSSQIQISLDGLSTRKINQLKRLKRMIKMSRAFSLFYYRKARMWKRLYWLTNVVAVVLAATSTVINLLYDPCSNQQLVKKYNVLFSAAITASLGAITFMNASLRRRNYEEAGDEYKILSTDMYREVFFTNLSYQELDLGALIERYTISLDDYSKMFEEPAPTKIQDIIDSEEFDLAVKFKF